MSEVRMRTFLRFLCFLLWNGVWDVQGAELPRGQISVYGMGPLLEDLEKVWTENPERVQTIGSEPIIGRQVCPPLTRLNLSKNRSELVLLAQLEETNDSMPGGAGGGGVKWSLTLKQGIAWWGGDPVTLDEFGAFIEVALPEAIRSVGRGFWEIPPYKIQKKAPLIVEVLWESAPRFGPYVLNGYSFLRILPEKKVPECAGLYRPEKKSWGMQLTPTPGYQMTYQIPKINLYFEPRDSAVGVPSHRLDALVEKGWIEFSGIWNRNLNRRCHAEIFEPFLTGLVWNHRTSVTNDPQLRKLLSQLIPRDTIVSIIGHKYVVSDLSFVSRSHPHRLMQGGAPFEASDSSVQKPSQTQSHESGLNKITSDLTRAGYLRPDPKGPRLDKGGKPIELSVVTRSSKIGLVEKVLGDVFSSVGIKINFESHIGAPEALLGTYDGFLGTLAIDWPEMNLLSNLHRKLPKAGYFEVIQGSAVLDQHLESFALNLTAKIPDFRDFLAIQKDLIDQEGITVIFHHKSCLTLSPNMIGNIGAITAGNPDWFRQLILVQ